MHTNPRIFGFIAISFMLFLNMVQIFTIILKLKMLQLTKNLASRFLSPHVRLMLLGAIFDWDGVIIDSINQHKESWIRLAKEESRTLNPANFHKGFGRKNTDIIPNLLQWTTDPDEIHRISTRKEELYREVLGETGLYCLPGVQDLLECLQEANFTCAIGSSTERKNIELALDMLNLRSYFTAIVSADDVDRGKPDPQVFLKAAMAINRDPKIRVVFEDAPVGIQAALAAGMKVVGVATTHFADALANAHKTVQALSDLDRSFYQELWA